MKIVTIMLCAVITIISTALYSVAFDDSITHPDLTESAFNIIKPKLESYLINQLGLPDGIKTKFNGQLNLFWLQTGSKAEDHPTCRASNHFHNPLLPWNLSQMSDDPWWLFMSVACSDFTPRYSNIVWATGQTAQNTPTQLRNNQTMGWDSARQYFYSALLAPDKAVREANYTKTFQAIGQVIHLLQDMAVPAHVRNDFRSHLKFTGIQSFDVTQWYNNRFEYFVRENPNLVNSSKSSISSISGALLTDFWDTDGRVSAPFRGLAEYTNAKYFSDSTIPNNKPSAEHQFPLPQITNANFICVDRLPGSNKPTKYVSRTACPSDGSSVDHFAAVSLVNNKSDSSAVSSIKKVWLDDNVNYTYASGSNGLLAKAVGYSAALLDYFFRGTIKLIAPETGTDPNAITLTATNITTNGDAMTNGTVALVLRYRQILNADESGTIPNSDYSYKVFPLSGNTDIPSGAGRELVFDISSDPLPDWANDVTAQVVYRGQLGNEAGAVAVGSVALKVASKALEISLPANGVYAATNGSSFNNITFNATTGLPGGLSQPDGVLQLVLIHRYSDSNPFLGTPVTTTPENPNLYHVIRATEATGINSLQQGVSRKLIFNISDTSLPLWASDIHIYLVYKHAGDPDSKALAVGYLDISEPTPVDAYNNTDYTCLNNTWYRYDDPEAMAIVDSNSDGIADRGDIYPHTISNIIFQGGSANAGNLVASPQQNNLFAAGPLQPGQMLRLGYILTDLSNRYTFDEQWTNFSTQDIWTNTSSVTTFPGTGFVNQANGGFGGMYNMRGSKMWWGTGVIYVNDPYPADSYCDTDLLNQPAR